MLKDRNIFKKKTNFEAKLAVSRLENSRSQKICGVIIFSSFLALGKEIKTTIHRIQLSSQLYLKFFFFFFFFFYHRMASSSYTGFFPSIALDLLKRALIRCTAVSRLCSILFLLGPLVHFIPTVSSAWPSFYDIVSVVLPWQCCLSTVHVIFAGKL